MDVLFQKGTDDESPIGDDIGATRQELSLLGNADMTPIMLEPGQTLQGTGFQITQPQDIPYSHNLISFRYNIHLPASMSPEVRKAFNDLHSTLSHVRLTARDITRWKMAWRVCQPPTRKMSGNGPFLAGPLHQQLLARRCTDGPAWDEIFKIPTILGFTAATFIYGGLHALAWSAHFDSATEKLLWRISSCIVMGGLPVILSLHGWLQNDMNDYIGMAIGCIEILMFVAYTLARAYLVVECFINVFYLPAGVFNTPEWSTYFPHIS